jgi:hypothetical protein
MKNEAPAPSPANEPPGAAVLYQNFSRQMGAAIRGPFPNSLFAPSLDRAMFSPRDAVTIHENYPGLNKKPI